MLTEMIKASKKNSYKNSIKSKKKLINNEYKSSKKL